MLGEFNIQQFVSAFVVLFAVIDVTGSIPIFLSLKKKGKKIDAKKAALLSLGMFIGFFYVGEAFLNLFHVDISSFAIAGSLIIFVMALEMILDIEIFKNSPDSHCFPSAPNTRISISFSPFCSMCFGFTSYSKLPKKLTAFSAPEPSICCKNSSASFCWPFPSNCLPTIWRFCLRK